MRWAGRSMQIAGSPEARMAAAVMAAPPPEEFRPRIFHAYLRQDVPNYAWKAGSPR